ncbi:hypothetical protein QP166_07020 [Sphingomonas sp. LR60]|uniref:hypothetical protein n=1 Tax=Sphingomonas sp. LR60 TaxID=3050233 RepID=UPI002FE07712
MRSPGAGAAPIGASVQPLPADQLARRGGNWRSKETLTVPARRSTCAASAGTISSYSG